VNPERFSELIEISRQSGFLIREVVLFKNQAVRVSGPNFQQSAIMNRSQKPRPAN
jgi:hypothetical protein